MPFLKFFEDSNATLTDRRDAGIVCKNSLKAFPFRTSIRPCIWVRFTIFMIQTLVPNSTVNGAGTGSPCRRRCNRSNWFIAR